MNKKTVMIKAGMNISQKLNQIECPAGKKKIQ